MATALPLPEPNVIRRIAEEVIQRPEFRVEPVGDNSDTMRDLILRMSWWILKPILWLFELTTGLAEWLRWPVTIGLIVVLVLLVGHIVYTVWTALRGPKHVSSFASESKRRRLDPATLERQANEALARHDYTTAIRLLFRAVLLWLEEYENRKFRAGTTNREYLRRYRSSPIFQPMKSFVETIDVKWYGLGTCSIEDYETCRLAHTQIRQMTRERKNAYRA